MNLPGLRPKTPADLQRARDGIGWVGDDDLRDVETKSRLGATALGFFTWGGGRVYVGDTLRGVALIGALLGWVALSSVLPAALGSLIFMLVGAACGVWSHHGARQVNRFAAVRDDLALRAGPDPANYRLLAAVAAINPAVAAAAPHAMQQAAAPAPAPTGPHAELIDRLRKLAALRRSGVLHDAEVKDRKVDLLSAAVPPSRAELDELLYALLPLGDEGVLVPDDFEFLKQLGETK